MDPHILVGIFIGLIVWFLVRYLAGGIYTVDQNQRAVKANFGRADRIPERCHKLLNPAGHLRKNSTGVRANQSYYSHHNYENHSQHNRVLSNILAFVAPSRH